MKKNLLNKFFVLGVFVLFIGLSALSSGFSANVNTNRNETKLSHCETCNAGCDMELVEIFPFHEKGDWFYNEWLTFGCKVKNVGTEPCLPSYGYQAYEYKFRTNELVDWYSAHCDDSEGLQPGEEAIFYSGLKFNKIIFPPTIFRLNYTANPFDSNMQNNYAEALYLIWGGFIFPCRYIKIKDIY